MATPFRSNLRLALDVPRWAGGFYVRQFAWIAGLSLIAAAAQVVVLLTDIYAWPLQLTTVAARVVLVGVIAWIAIGKDPWLNWLSWRAKWLRARDYCREWWPSLLLQLPLLAVLVILVGLVPELFVWPHVPPDSQPISAAIVLVITNLTIWAFALVWLVGAIRQTMLYAPDEVPVER